MTENNPQTLEIQDTQILTQPDLEKIKNFLPHDWRLKIRASHPDLTTRQITETFYCRTKNSSWAEIVFTAISRILDAAGQSVLSEKCKSRIRLCQAAHHLAA
jgi:hypothetical protein